MKRLSLAILLILPILIFGLGNKLVRADTYSIDGYGIGGSLDVASGYTAFSPTFSVNNQSWVFKLTLDNPSNVSSVVFQFDGKALTSQDTWFTADSFNTSSPASSLKITKFDLSGQKLGPHYLGAQILTKDGQTLYASDFPNAQTHQGSAVGVAFVIKQDVGSSNISTTSSNIDTDAPQGYLYSSGQITQPDATNSFACVNFGFTNQYLYESDLQSASLYRNNTVVATFNKQSLNNYGQYPTQDRINGQWADPGFKYCETAGSIADLIPGTYNYSLAVTDVAGNSSIIANGLNKGAAPTRTIGAQTSAATICPAAKISEISSTVKRISGRLANDLQIAKTYAANTTTYAAAVNLKLPNNYASLNSALEETYNTAQNDLLSVQQSGSAIQCGSSMAAQITNYQSKISAFNSALKNYRSDVIDFLDALAEVN